MNSKSPDILVYAFTQHAGIQITGDVVISLQLIIFRFRGKPRGGLAVLGKQDASSPCSDEIDRTIRHPPLASRNGLAGTRQPPGSERGIQANRSDAPGSSGRVGNSL